MLTVPQVPLRDVVAQVDAAAGTAGMAAEEDTAEAVAVMVVEEVVVAAVAAVVVAEAEVVVVEDAGAVDVAEGKSFNNI